MKKKITMLLASLLACVGVMKAAVTDLPQMSTGDDIKWYTISNTRSTSGKYLYWTESGVKDSNTKTTASLFYFTGTAEECYIHNAATDHLFTGAGAWNANGVKCKISVTPYGDGTTGLAIEFSGTALNEKNTGDGYTTWGADDAGSVFVIEEAPVAQMVADYKAAANTALDMLPISSVAEAKVAIESLESNVDAFAAVDAIVNGVAQHVAFRNADTKEGSVRVDAYLLASMTDVKGHGNKPFNHLTGTWSLKYSGEGSFYIYNVNQEVYLGSPSSNGALTEAPNAAYTFEKIEDNKVEFKHAGQTLHLNNHAGSGPIVNSGTFLSNYDGDDPASRWHVETDFAALVSAYKTSAITTLDSWATLSVVFDAELIETARTAINAIETTDYATFAAIDAELKNVTDKVAAKYFTFKNSDTSNDVRVNAYLAANMSDNEGHGTKTFGYNAIWRLISAGGTSFYLYNELNGVYLGTPSSNGDLTATPSASYSFEIVDAETNKAELKRGNETLHLNNHTDGLLSNYDHDDAASRWYIAEYDYKADLTALIEENENNHEVVPALGKYTTAAYNALVEAGNTATTVAEVAEAIAAFEASLNRPVYFITSKHDGYAAGSAIYYDGAWKWKTANIYNKQMWMAIPGYTEENVPVVDAYDANGTSYAICDFLTGTKMRGKDVQIVKVAGWEGAYSLQYNADATSTDAAQHAQNGGNLVNWKPALANDCQASAWSVEYIGNSYDLDKLTDEYFAKGNELAAINVPNFSFAAGVNNYDEATKPALDAAVANRATVLGKLSTEEEIAAAKTQLEAAIAGVQINMPENGKFYRVRCTDGNRRILSTLNADGSRLTLANTETDESIYCYTDGALLSYTTGLYMNAYNFNAVGASTAVTFQAAHTGTVGCYNIKVGDRWIYGAGETIDSGTGNNPDNRAGYRWWLEEVTTLPVTVTAAGYATLYAPVALTIPAGVKAYTGTVKGDYLTLNPVEGTIPANTGVILEASQGTYNFAVTADVDAIEGNALTGSAPKSVKNADKKVYTLQNGSNGPGLYRFNGVDSEGNTTYINGFRAWVELDAAAAVNALRITRGDETGIDQIISNDELVIYDLAGRRVEKMEKGIYIVNGKKVVIK